MNLSAPFINRPVATSLLTAALALSGVLAFRLLPVAALPEVEFPTIQVHANLPGASPETMASSVATPLERQFGRIASITEMTSSSQLSSTSITLQFDLSRNIDAAGRDVQAAINAARGQLPADLPSNPGYWKSNPADAPILMLALSSDTYARPQMYDAADSILAQKIAQIEGVGQVHVWGSSRPAVRVQVNPMLLNNMGLGMVDVATMLQNANAHQAKGALDGDTMRWQVNATDQLFHADEYAPLIVTYRNGAPVRLRELGNVIDSVEDTRNDGLDNGKPNVILAVSRQPQANIIDTVDHITAVLPRLQASIPPGMHLKVAQDRTNTIRASVKDVEYTLLIAIVLVVLVVFAFLRSAWATIIPGIAVPLSLCGTFGVMYLLGYTLDNLSLMALTVSTGFVVDDAIVVIENITRYLEIGWDPVRAALQGAKEIGFTVLSMSTSLVAVFIPILLMGGIVGRLFREFAITLTVAIAISLVVSLTTTPMMCAKFLRSQNDKKHNFLYNASERGFNLIHTAYAKTLMSVLRHPQLTLVITLVTIAISVYLYVVVPKGFFPQQDTGRIGGAIVADQDISFTAMKEKLHEALRIVQKDPAVDDVQGFTGGGTLNNASMWAQLKPLEQRKVSADQVINRLRGKLSHIPGATLYMQAAQDIRVGGRGGNSQYQFTLQSDKLSDLSEWAPKLLNKLRTVPVVLDANSDQQVHGLESKLIIDRTTASRLGISPQAIDTTLYSAFGQRQVSTMYTGINQYHVVLEVLPEFQQNPASLDSIYVRSSNGTPVPVSTFTQLRTVLSPLTVNHQGQFPSITLSFALAPGVALSQAVEAVQTAEDEIGMPANVHGAFAGTAQAFQASLKSEPLLILAALLAVYIVLGMLYESYIHPITILSTIPSAGVGALLALLICGIDLTVIALIGIILLIGIVKKNAIMMIDFALELQRKDHMSPKNAIYQACLLRFRPIIMTTLAALLGGLPLALGTGTGSELRRPLGITIVGGLMLSQLLTLYTTPVVYLYLDKLQAWFGSARQVSPRLQTALTDSVG
ncbi:MAG: multidrug efflux RND transporter permease subunit [Acidobacteriota bacterium]|nr:multidrug efflux RND transporter permease subunit [Acidobacteriota bacterium]MDQ2842762.1 multidrug efflux RND transporter permease subunit [Acidobacteriota bacterium]